MQSLETLTAYAAGAHAPAATARYRSASLARAPSFGARSRVYSPLRLRPPTSVVLLPYCLKSWSA